MRIASRWFVNEEAKAEEFQAQVFPSLPLELQEDTVLTMKEDNGVLHDPEKFRANGSGLLDEA